MKIDEFRQSDELVAERDAYEAEQEMKNWKFRARCIQWDRTDDNGVEHYEADLPSEVTVTLEDLQLPNDAKKSKIEDELAIYLTDYYGFNHFGFFFEEMEDWQ